MARYEPRASTGRVPSLFLKAKHSSQGVGAADLDTPGKYCYKESIPGLLTLPLVSRRYSTRELSSVATGQGYLDLGQRLLTILVLW